jgi:outer membrane protein assembly factor BamA
LTILLAAQFNLALAQKKRTTTPAPAKPADPAKTIFPIETLTVEGNKKIPADKIIAASGLKLGQPALKADFDAARDRLVATGAFLSVAYEFKPGPSGKGYAGIFQVLEMEPLFPFLFEDLPRPDAELRAALHKKHPLLGDERPGSKEMLARYVADLEQILDPSGAGKVKVAGRIISDDVNRPTIIFRPPIPRAHVLRVQFTGNQVLPTSLLVNTLSGVAVGVPYSEANIRKLLDASIRPLYEARGRLRSTFPTIDIVKDDHIDGVILTVSVVEGPSYNLGKVRISGVSAAEIKDFDRIANWKTGDIANFDEIQTGVDRIRDRLREKGHLHAAANIERSIDDTARAVDLVIALTPGPQFLFGKLEIKGLDLISEPVIRKMWGARQGKPFQPAIPDSFLAEIRDEGLFDNLGKTYAETKVNDSDRTVDVTLHFEGKGPEKDEDRRKKRIP